MNVGDYTRSHARSEITHQDHTAGGSVLRFAYTVHAHVHVHQYSQRGVVLETSHQRLEIQRVKIIEKSREPHGAGRLECWEIGWLAPRERDFYRSASYCTPLRPADLQPIRAQRHQHGRVVGAGERGQDLHVDEGARGEERGREQKVVEA